MKIAFLSRYQGRTNRGVETYVAELSKRLSKNHEVVVFQGKDADNLGKILSSKFDIVIPTNGRWQSLKVSLGKLIGHYKTIISGQAGIGRDDIWNILITRPNVYVGLTNYESSWAKKWAWGTKIVTIPNGVDLEKFSPNGKKVNLGLKRPIVLSVGALYWYKRHVSTITAVYKVSAGSLLIIGDGPEKEKLQNYGNELLGKDKFQILQVPYKDMPKYYRSADVFALPSWNREAFGIVYVEAMASGLPVVAPDDTPRREIMGDASIFASDVTDRQKYGNAILEALSKDWGNKPRKQAEKFSWDKIAEKYEKLFEEIT